MTKVACHGPIIAFVIISNSCCVAMWHIVNSMMETLTLTLTRVKWDHVTHGDSNSQNGLFLYVMPCKPKKLCNLPIPLTSSP
jgi:hypothetical protein